MRLGRHPKNTHFWGIVHFKHTHARYQKTHILCMAPENSKKDPKHKKTPSLGGKHETEGGKKCTRQGIHIRLDATHPYPTCMWAIMGTNKLDPDMHLQKNPTTAPITARIITMQLYRRAFPCSDVPNISQMTHLYVKKKLKDNCSVFKGKI